MLSKNLPSGFPIAILAGRGDYPVICANNIAAAGHEFVVIAVDDEVDMAWIGSLPSAKVARVEVGQISKLLHTLKGFGARAAIMAGQVKPKKLFHGLKPDLKALWLLATLKEHNAASIFGAIANEIEQIGITVLDARIFMDNLLAEVGTMAGKKSNVDGKVLDFGIRIARELARLNIGQSVIVRKGVVLAVEDFAGTDVLIKRAEAFALSDMFFVKTSKSDQDFRFDVPVIGMRTLENLHAAKISSVALEADKVLIFDKPNVLKKAQEYGITMLGF